MREHFFLQVCIFQFLVTNVCFDASSICAWIAFILSIERRKNLLDEKWIAKQVMFIVMTVGF